MCSTSGFVYLRTHTECFPHTHTEFQISVVSEYIFGFDAYQLGASQICVCMVTDLSTVMSLGLPRSSFLPVRLSHFDDSLDSLKWSICRETAR